ncbi:response regulator [Oscillatoriales cyanobacterium LEGE 11467]|uniref:Circadian input-output histidine kinase CikA n=1 Tax=Zarconia navalis LEGE 11467 TaxID=1828826 RepID=A0A928W3S1_9CYAN|nr:response regulator [Zarconia navalis]MBE9042660.1 response regulator [Zarconia navalis LEGE 11467]
MKRHLSPIWQTLKTKFYYLSISRKLDLGFGVLVALTFLVVGRNYLGGALVAAKIDRTQELRVPTALTLAHAQADLLQMSSHVRGYLATGDSEFRHRYQQARQKFEEHLALATEGLQNERLRDLPSPENIQRLQELQEKYQAWKALPEQLFVLRDSGRANQPALRLLEEEGEISISIILSEIDNIIEEQATRSPSLGNTKLLQDMGDFQRSFALSISSLRGYLVTRDPSFRFEYAGYSNRNRQAWEQLLDRRALLSATQQKRLDEIARRRNAFAGLPQKMFDIVEGDRYREDLYVFGTDAEPLAAEMLGLLEEIVISQQSALTAELESGNKSLATAQWQTLLGGLLVVLVVAGMAVLMRRKIAAPIRRLTRATTQIVEGKFDTKAEVESGDEIGTLATSFNQMTDSLKQSRQELENYNRNLEQQVEERTVALAEAKETAEAANRAKSDFLAKMSHDLRTPLNGILGIAQILQDSKAATSREREEIDIIYQSGQHLLDLIDDILDLSKIEAGKMELNSHDCAFPSFLRGIVELCRIRTQEKKIEFHDRIAATLPQMVKVDEKRLRQVLLNLLGNAIKFTDLGRVTLTVNVLNRIEAIAPPPDSTSPNVTSLDGATSSLPMWKIHVQIEDTGVGISPEELDKIFLPFEQVGDNQRRSQGTGLGLAISQKLLEMMGSQLQVRSQRGVGSTFSLTLDLPEAAPDLAMATSPSTKVTLSGFDPELAQKLPLDILLAEDTPVNQKVARRMFQRLGYEIELARDGTEVLEALDRQSYDVIFMDIQMPELDGLETTRRIYQERAPYSRPYIIAMTANAMEGDRDRCLAVGMNDYISKPVKVEAIIQALYQYQNTVMV